MCKFGKVEKLMGKLLIDISEYQQKVLDCISSEEINKFFNSTMFAGTPESSMCKQADSWNGYCKYDNKSMQPCHC